MRLTLLDAEVRKVAPIDGVCGDLSDRQTWGVQFTPDATDEQRAAAQTVLDTWDPNKPAIADIKAEAQRRIIALTGAADLQSSMIRQMNALMRASEITNKIATGELLTAAETVDATQLKLMASAIKAIRTRSNALEAELPNDYTADARWSPV